MRNRSGAREASHSCHIVLVQLKRQISSLRPILSSKISIRFEILGPNTKKNSKNKHSYWLGANFWTQGVYNRVLVQGMKKWSGTHVASLSCQISVHRTQENTLLGLRNRSSSLSPKVRSLKGFFVPQVYWTQILLLTHPKYAWVWFSTWFVVLDYGFPLWVPKVTMSHTVDFYFYFATILNLDLKLGIFLDPQMCMEFFELQCMVFF